MEQVRMFDIAYALEQLNKIPKPSARVVACIDKAENLLCQSIEGIQRLEPVPLDTGHKF